MPSRREKRAAEKAFFEDEFRKTFGRPPPSRTELVVPPDTYDPQKARKEEERAAAHHDPAKPSACRCCGITVTDGPTVSGWKVCPQCAELLPGGLAAVLSELVGAPVEPGEVVALLERMGTDNPCTFVTGWPREPGMPTRWAHVRGDFAERALSELATMRDGRPRTNTFGTGCAFCGVRTSVAWTKTPHRYQRGGPLFAACADCQRDIAAPGGGREESWRPRLLAVVTGMRRAQMGFDLGVRAFFESGRDPEGTDEPFQYLGDTRTKLRARAIRNYPRQVELTERERRVLDLEAVMAEAEHPPQRVQLADLG